MVNGPMSNALRLKIQIYMFHFPFSFTHTNIHTSRNAIRWSATATIINLVIALDHWINHEAMQPGQRPSQLHPAPLSIQFTNIRRRKWRLPSWISIVVAIIYGKCAQNMISLTDIRRMHGNSSFRPATALHGAMYSKRHHPHGCTISIY